MACVNLLSENNVSNNVTGPAVPGRLLNLFWLAQGRHSRLKSNRTSPTRCAHNQHGHTTDRHARTHACTLTHTHAHWSSTLVTSCTVVEKVHYLFIVFNGLVLRHPLALPSLSPHTTDTQTQRHTDTQTHTTALR